MRDLRTKQAQLDRLQGEIAAMQSAQFAICPHCGLKPSDPHAGPGEPIEAGFFRRVEQAARRIGQLRARWREGSTDATR